MCKSHHSCGILSKFFLWFHMNSHYIVMNKSCTHNSTCLKNEWSFTAVIKSPAHDLLRNLRGVHILLLLTQQHVVPVGVQLFASGCLSVPTVSHTHVYQMPCPLRWTLHLEARSAIRPASTCSHVDTGTLTLIYSRVQESESKSSFIKN